MTEASMTNWMNSYRSTLDKVRCLPGTALSPDVLLRVWYAYLGGIHMARGHQVLGQFLKQVVDPTVDASPTLPNHNHSSSMTSNSVTNGGWMR